jgi:ATP-dependent DNA helicase RecG
MLEPLGTKLEREELLARYRNNKSTEVSISEWSPLTRNLRNSLPYSLTSSQLNAVSEIILDLKKPIPMNRLLQVYVQLSSYEGYMCVLAEILKRYGDR